MTESGKREWVGWSTDPVAAKTGVSFDRTPAGKIAAPVGRFRVCAYHVDHDEHPTCFTDVATRDEAVALCDHLGDHCSWNVDFAVVYDDEGNCVHDSCPW
ncbi:MAG: hypothetical protein ACXWUG_04630 [Polyangiales bacterium]